nr:thermonuclease family protein [Rubrivivax gelatinosus]
MVVGISDGDTLTARCDNAADPAQQTVRVRLAEIDAPESRQAFGTRSRQNLALLCFGQPALVAPLVGSAGRDRYGRLVARVTCSGVDANAAQVRSGMAWVYRAYARDLSLLDLEADARIRAVGLWADSRPTPPWEWRADRRTPRHGS